MGFLSLLDIGGSIWGASSQMDAAEDAANIQRNAAQAAADKTMIESERGSGDIRDTASAGASSIEQAGNRAWENLTNAGERSYAGTVGAGLEGRDQIYNAMKSLDPYSQAGESALNRLTAGLSSGGEFSSKFQFDPNLLNDAGVQFRIAQGTKALQNSAAGKGLIGGNVAKAITDYSQGVASDEYNNAFNRSKIAYDTNRSAILDPLQSLIAGGAAANNARISGTNAAEGLHLNALEAGGTALTNAANSAAGFQTQGVQTAADSRNTAERAAAALRAQATQNASQYGLEGANALAAGKVGSANAFAQGLSGVSKGIAGLFSPLTP